ncbi:MAG: FadR/GntR family transcriptional regulator [Bacillota bacterium]
MEIRREKKTRLYKTIVKQIQQSIKDGVLAPGDQLLPERQLAEMLGVSRSAVREALTALESMGLLEITPGGGAYVKEANIEHVLDPIATIVMKEKEYVYHLLEARKILEIESIKLATERATKTDLYKIKDAAEEMQAAVLQGNSADEGDINFHLNIVEATHNPVLISFMTMLSGLMKEAYGPSRKKLLRDTEKAKVFCQQNFNIYQAIANRDALTAQRLMDEHLTMAEAELAIMDDQE